MCVPCEYSPSVSLEEEFNNQVAGTNCPMDTAQSLPPVAPVIIQWAQKHSGHGGGDGGYQWVKKQGLLLTRADLAVATTA